MAAPAGYEVRSSGGLRYITYDWPSLPREVSALTTIRMPSIDAMEQLGPRSILTGISSSIEQALGVKCRAFVAGGQVHSANVACIDDETLAENLDGGIAVVPQTDGLLTSLRNVALVVLTADCLPIFLHDPMCHVIGLVHAGKKGTEQHIIETAVEILNRRYASQPADIQALIGVSIGPCHYDTDLWAENERQLQSVGVPAPKNFLACSGCNLELFYSYRVEMGKTGRMVSVAILN